MVLCSRVIRGPPKQLIASSPFSPRIHNTTNSCNHKAALRPFIQKFQSSSLLPPPSSPLYIIHNRHNFSATAMDNPQSTLPPGFRFHPTDEELILHYLSKKVTSTPFPVSIIADVDIYKFDPWELPGKAVFGEKEWYFFSPRDRKYPNGLRPNRAAASGYWKATGTDKTIVAASSIGGGGHGHIGVKKALVFYQGRPPKGIKTNWIMHEYRLAQPPNPAINKPPLKLRDASMRLDNWVLCRIYKKSNAVPPATAAAIDDDREQEDSFMEESLKSHPNQSTIQPQKPSSFSNILDAMDSSTLGHLFSDIQYSDPTGFEPTPPAKYGSLGQSNDILPKLPYWKSVPSMENQLKRQRSSMDGDVPCPSKKLTSSCTSTTNPNQSDLPQSYFNQSLFNQPLLLNPYFPFQG